MVLFPMGVVLRGFLVCGVHIRTPQRKSLPATCLLVIYMAGALLAAQIGLSSWPREGVAGGLVRPCPPKKVLIQELETKFNDESIILSTLSLW
jgi:hypothetical protein